MAETKAPKVTVVPEEELYYSTDEEKMTVDERKLYRKMVRESQGFDVPRVTVEGCGQIVPLKTLRHSMENLKFCCKLAMNEYRKKEGKRLKLVKIVKANLQVCSPMNYYITFEAKDSHGRVNEYQAMIRYRLPKEKSVVEIMRLKPEVSSSGIPDAAPSAESSKPEASYSCIPDAAPSAESSK